MISELKKKTRNILAKKLEILDYMAIFHSHPTRYVFSGLYGHWIIWPKNADLGAVPQKYGLYGRPYNPVSTVGDLGHFNLNHPILEKKRVILHFKQIFDPPFRRQGGVG